MLGYHAGMDDLLVAAPPRTNLTEYTVSELSQALKRSIEDGFSHVRVRGEVSGFKRHGSGHCYLALKDSDAVLGDIGLCSCGIAETAIGRRRDPSADAQILSEGF